MPEDQSIGSPAIHTSLNAESFIQKLTTLDAGEKEFGIKKAMLLRDAFRTDDPNLILKASQYLDKIEQRGQERPKSLIIDNTVFNGSGYRDKSFSVSYDLLRNMGRTPIIKSIIETRIEQISDFMHPQEDRYSTGFIIRPKKKSHFSDEEPKITKAQLKRCGEITDWIMNCGNKGNRWHGDDLESFARKVMRDSFTFDQMCWENIDTRGGDLAEIIATDGGSMRFSDQMNTDDFEKLTSMRQGVRLEKKMIKGYPPYYVQVYMGRVIAEFYPWELCFGIRNPQTSILSNGYGRSELEDLISTVTSILNVDAYNANYFKVGSNPKGILRVTGNMSSDRINEFKHQWQTQMSGVANAHKLPVIEADKMDFISTQGTNKEMEYSKYEEFLIKTCCAVFKMDPSEIGFPMSGSADAAPMFEGNNEARLKHSKDKGLKPTVKFFENKFNKYVIDRLDPDYEWKAVGLSTQSAEEELNSEIKKVQNFKTMNEVRKEYGLKEIEGGDIVLNPIVAQMKQMEAMNGGGQQQESTDAADQNPFAWDDNNSDDDYEKSHKISPIVDALNKYIKRELIEHE